MVQVVHKNQIDPLFAQTDMDPNMFSDHEVAEHIKLLRRASRVRLALLGIWVLLTWGLWTTLQAGDQQAATIENAYDSHLVELRGKWDIPADVITNFAMDCLDLIKEMEYLKHPTENTKIYSFCSEKDALRDKFYAALGPAYIVHAKMPYLQDPVDINGITLANWWPFGLIAITASAIVLSMRERVNAVIVSWISYNRKATSAKSDLIVHSDFLVGTLEESPEFDPRCMVYHRPLMIQPESLLIYALVAATVYLSFTFGFFQNPASSEMESTLLDYVAFIWFFLTVMGSLVWRTRKRYKETLETCVGMPVRGGISQRTHRVVVRWRHWIEQASSKLGSLGYTRSIIGLSCIVGAGLSLFLVWMNPNGVRGYRFFSATTVSPFEDDMYSELRVQLCFAAIFVVVCLIDWIATTARSGKPFRLLFKVRRFLGISTLVLLGNLVFHFMLLQVLAQALADRFLGMPSWNSLARPHPIQNSPLIWMEPEHGFWFFLIFCFILVAIGKKEPSKHLRAAAVPAP